MPYKQKQPQHRNRLADPEPGFFKLCLRRDGPFVPAVIFLPCPVDPYTGYPLDRGRRLLAAIEYNDPDYEGIEKIWVFGIAIKRAEYKHMLAVAAWARVHAPLAPEAAPATPIDHLTTPINF